MNKRISLIITVLISMLTFISCSRDHLYLASSDTAQVNLVIDWNKAGISPNGATVFAYNEDGTLYRQFAPFSNPNMGTIYLPYGHYKLIVMNDTPDELSESMTFTGKENLSTFRVVGKTNTGNSSAIRAGTRSNDDRLMVIPDTLAVGYATDVIINEFKKEYFYERPDNDEGIFKLDSTIVITPERVTCATTIKIHVTGLKYAKGSIMSYLSGTSGGYSVGLGEYSPESVSYGFILNNRTFDPGSTTDGTISATINAFGLIETIENGTAKYELTINFVLVNGEVYTMTYDVTNQIDVSLDVQVQLGLELNLDISLPEVVGGDDDNNDNGFMTDVSIWDDIVENIKM